MTSSAGERRDIARPTVLHRIEWLVVRVALSVIDVLPESWLLGSSRLAARIAAVVAVRRRRVVERRVFERLGFAPGSRDSRRIVRGAFEALLLNMVEPVLLERALRRHGSLDGLLTVEGEESLRGALASGRGVLLATGHIGAWESLLIVWHTQFRPSWIVSRELRNPLLDRLLLEWRLHRAKGRLPKDGSARRMAQLLAAGECVGMLLDQNAGRHGILLDFLGAPASHQAAAGVMAVRTRSLVVPIYLLRQDSSHRLRLVIDPPIEARRGSAAAAAAEDVTRRVSASLERQVQAHPEQWLWLHDRWKRAERMLLADEPGGSFRAYRTPAQPPADAARVSSPR